MGSGVVDDESLRDLGEEENGKQVQTLEKRGERREGETEEKRREDSKRETEREREWEDLDTTTITTTFAALARKAKCNALLFDRRCCASLWGAAKRVDRRMPESM